MLYGPYPWFGPHPCGFDSETQDYKFPLTLLGESQMPAPRESQRPDPRKSQRPISGESQGLYLGESQMPHEGDFAMLGPDQSPPDSPQDMPPDEGQQPPPGERVGEKHADDLATQRIQLDQIRLMGKYIYIIKSLNICAINMKFEIIYIYHCLS